MKYYLMIKEAPALGIKYLCKCGDYKDHIAYRGSGTLWRRILAKHNPEIETVVLGIYDNQDDLAKAGQYYSDLYDIVNSPSWANLVPEVGDGGPTVSGKIRAYNINTLKERFFDADADLPPDWVRGCIRPPKDRASVERSAKSHRGRKRSEITRENMRNSTRRKRRVDKCAYCSGEYTPQNIKRHEERCSKNEKNA